ncbi:MAG: leucyl/phenylalanyl-tRNA--protein transferase [Pseudomonadota bacterium]
MSQRLDAEALLRCYRRGVFPMADSPTDPNLFLVDPDLRGVLPLDGFHIPRKLRKTVRKAPFSISINKAFSRVMDGCARPAPGRENTWINPLIHNLYGQLHRMGHAHSVEAWDKDTLVGGLYGVSLGGAFFGESMFSAARDASKVCLVHLAARLIRRGYTLLDAQFHNPHLEQFGLAEIFRREFKAELAAAITVDASFAPGEPVETGDEAIAIIDSART